jgi:hypothetical protein
MPKCPVRDPVVGYLDAALACNETVNKRLTKMILRLCFRVAQRFQRCDQFRSWKSSFSSRGRRA